MPFSSLLIGVFIFKAILLWLFYSRLGAKPLLIGILGCLAWYPLLTILYHETNINFLFILVLVTAADIFMYNFLLQKNWLKSILLSVILNLFAMVFFLFVNG